MDASQNFAQAETLLDVRGLSLRFRTKGGEIHALTDVSFHVKRGEILCLVGESGCGKSVTAMSIMGLTPRKIADHDGAILYRGNDLLRYSEKQMSALRGNAIGMVFQDPMTSLNPTLTIETQIGEVLTRHKGMSRAAARARALQLLDLVQIPDARARLSAYPYELSGGMRQRVMIAVALACDPDLLIADEPTTALDVTVQAQILSLIGELKAELGMSVILITHDLGVVAKTADRVAVMYAGRIVEEGRTADLFAHPSHAYTLGLLEALPTLSIGHKGELAEIAGTVPRLDRRIEACVYAPRCPHASPACREPIPGLQPVAPGHRSACIRVDVVEAAAGHNEIVRIWR